MSVNWLGELMLDYLIPFQKQCPFCFHGHWIGKTDRLLCGKYQGQADYSELPCYPETCRGNSVALGSLFGSCTCN